MSVTAATLMMAWRRTAPPLFEGALTHGHYTHKTSTIFAGRYWCWNVHPGLERPPAGYPQSTLDYYHSPETPQVLYQQFLLNRALAAIIKEFSLPLRALFQRSPCTTYSRVSYFTLPPHLLHRTTNRPHARVTTGIRPEEGHPHESYTGPCWRT